MDKKALTQNDVDTAVKYAAALQGEAKRRWIWLSSYAGSMLWDDSWKW